jgi:hypothetical protein
VSSAVECLAGPDQDVRRGAEIPKQAVGALGASIRGFVRLGHDNRDVVVAVRPCVAALRVAIATPWRANPGLGWPRQGSFGDDGEPEARYPDSVSFAMHTAKETVRRLLDDLPDNASLEDIQYHIYVREKIERGLRDVEAGRVVDQDEAKRRMAKWLGE